MKTKTESASKYLRTRLGIVNESLKKAYISGKRIFVLITNEPDFVTDLIARESILPIEYRKREDYTDPETRQTTVTYSGNNSVVYVDENPNFIKSEAIDLNYDNPTIFVNTTELVPYDSLLNYARHISGITSFRDSKELEKIDILKKSIILLVSPSKPSDGKSSSNKQNIIPRLCDSLTEYINVPYLSQNEFNEILSLWLNKQEDIKTSVGEYGFIRIDNSNYLDRMYQVMRALSPSQIRACLKKCQLEYGKLYSENENDPRLDTIIKKIRSISDEIISKSGALSLIDSSKAACPDGLARIIQWLDENNDRIRYPQLYEKYQMRPPKGILISGIPGSGKSMLAKYISAKLKLSLVRLDLGDALGSYVGESEKGFKTALEVVEALSPCVLWIDEMEKMFEGGHEVTRRLIGKFLTWMQEKTDRGISCFVYATANDISKMPPEMFRSGRFDEKFYTFMPNAADCATIFESSIRHQNNVYEKEQPELARIQPLFNLKKINYDLFISILNSEACLKSEIKRSWDGMIPRNNKFFIGSDIEQLIISAKSIYLNKVKDVEHKDAVFDSDNFIECIEQAISQMKTYGETNLDKIAYAFSEIARNNFTPASEHDIMPIDGYNEANYKQAIRKDRNTSIQLYSIQGEENHLHSLKNEYDRQLYLIISKTLNSISLDIIENKR